jgi:Xaa-Pro aminopeptidase
MRKRQFAAVVTPDGHDVLLVVNVERQQAASSSRIGDVRDYNEFTEDPMEVLAAILHEIGVDKGRVGVELDFLPARSYATLTRVLPHVDFVDAEKVFDRLRMLKTSDEIAILKTIGGYVDRAHRAAYAEAKPGWTELQLGNAIRQSILEQGGEGINNLVIGSGPRSTWANCPPTAKVIEVGEIVRVDVFAHIKGYQSDIARTVIVGEPTAKHLDYWRRLVDTHTTVLDMIKPGVRTAEIWSTFLKKFEEHKLVPTINFVGHGLGLTLHEDPYIDRYSDSTLEEGMVMSIEPVSHPEEMGFHIEDEVIVTANGHELISDGRGDIMCIR